MLNLHQAVSETRSTLKWGGITVVILLVIFFLYRGGQFIYSLLAPPPPPTVAFGKLPPIVFPESKVQKKLSFAIDTLTGSLPGFSDRATINSITQPQPNILALSRAQQRVENSGFLSSGNALSTSVYQWDETDSQTQLSRTLIANILTFNFTMTSSFLSNEEVIKAESLPQEQEAIDLAKQFFTDLSSYPQDIDESKTTTALFAIQDGTLVPADSFSDAQIVRVDFFQKDVNQSPLMYPNYPESTINAYVGSGGFNGQVVQAEFIHHPISDIIATYPIKTAQEAFDDLQKGQGYIVSYGGSGTKVGITKVYLGYYAGRLDQNYLMPIAVFEGKDNFLAYVSSVKNECVGK